MFWKENCKYNIKKGWEVRSFKKNLQQYCVDISSLSDDVVEGLRSCMGMRITETCLPHYDKALATSIFNLIEGIKLEKLEMFVDLPEEEAG